MDALTVEDLKKQIAELEREKTMALEVGDFCSVEYFEHQIEGLYAELHKED